MTNIRGFQQGAWPLRAGRAAAFLWLASVAACGGGYGGGGGGMGGTGGYGGMMATAPKITSVGVQPSQSVAAGTAVTFSVIATGTAPLSYQWMFNGANINMATAATYAITSVASANGGSYAVQVSNAYGKITSSPVLLTVM